MKSDASTHPQPDGALRIGLEVDVTGSNLDTAAAQNNRQQRINQSIKQTKQTKQTAEQSQQHGLGEADN